MPRVSKRGIADEGRPKKDIDEEQVLRLAAINCSYAEMAAVLGCDESTLTRRFAQVIKKGREQGNMSLKRKQYEIAMGGNVTMLIWLGKQRLDQREKIEQRTESVIENKTNSDLVSLALNVFQTAALKKDPNAK